jgi:hypothetical protein
MANTNYILQAKDKQSFPIDLDTKDKKYSRLLSWLKWRYQNYSEAIVSRNTVKAFPEDFGIDDYGSNTWGKRSMRERVSSAAEAMEINSPSDDHPLMPGTAYEHLIGRMAAYKVAKRIFYPHNCLKGVKSRNLGPHIFVQEVSKIWRAPRRLIYEVWHADSQQRQIDAVSIAEFWKYGRFFATNGRRSMRVEIWYDSRPWSRRERLMSPAEIILEEHIKKH